MIVTSFITIFFISCAISFLSFSLGKMIGRMDAEMDRKNHKRDPPKIVIDLSNISDSTRRVKNIIDVEYEDIACNLKKSGEKERRIIRRDMKDSLILNK
jgi:hypothetical protein